MNSGRKSVRRNVFQTAAVYDEAGKLVVSCVVRDVSATGARLELRNDVPLPRSFSLALTRDATVRRSCETVWQLSIVAGVSFRNLSRPQLDQHDDNRDGV